MKGLYSIEALLTSQHNIPQNFISLYTHTSVPTPTFWSFSGTNYDFDKVQAKRLEKDIQISLVHDHDTDRARNDFLEGRLSRRSSSAEILSVSLDQSLDDVLATSEDPHKPSAGSHHRRSSSTATYEDIKMKSSPSFEATIPSPPLPTTEPLVDVRIIDFAHSTHKGLDDPVVYAGPDHGFLFGLENMIAILKGIERDHGWDVLEYHCNVFMWFSQASLFHKKKAIALWILIHKQWNIVPGHYNAINKNTKMYLQMLPNAMQL